MKTTKTNVETGIHIHNTLLRMGAKVTDCEDYMMYECDTPNGFLSVTIAVYSDHATITGPDDFLTPC